MACMNAAVFVAASRSQAMQRNNIVKSKLGGVEGLRGDFWVVGVQRGAPQQRLKRLTDAL